VRRLPTPLRAMGAYWRSSLDVLKLQFKKEIFSGAIGWGMIGEAVRRLPTPLRTIGAHWRSSLDV